MPMYLTLIVGLVTVALAARRTKSEQAWILAGGSVLALASGLIGVATGLQMVAAHYRDFPEPLVALATGLRELSYNGVFAAMVSAALMLSALVLRPRTIVGPNGA